MQTTKNRPVVLVLCIALIVLLLAGAGAAFILLQPKAPVPVGLDSTGLQYFMTVDETTALLGAAAETNDEKFDGTRDLIYKQTLYGKPCETVYTFSAAKKPRLQEVSVTFTLENWASAEAVFSQAHAAFSTLYKQESGYYENEFRPFEQQHEATLGVQTDKLALCVSLAARDNCLQISLSADR